MTVPAAPFARSMRARIGYRKRAVGGPAGVLGLSLALALAAPAPVAGGEGAGWTLSSRGTEPCLFFRLQAYDRGLEHFDTAIHWACEVIARRRAAGMALSDRLVAAETAFEAYRLALVAATRIGVPLTDVEREAIATASGALLAVEALAVAF
jgi:hypothetical protein